MRKGNGKGYGRKGKGRIHPTNACEQSTPAGASSSSSSNTAPQSTSSLPVKDKQPGSSSSSGPGPVIQSRNDGSKPPRVKVNRLKLAQAKMMGDPSKAALKLLACLFTAEELVNSSPTGATNSKNPKRVASIAKLESGRMKYLKGSIKACTCMHIHHLVPYYIVIYF